MNNIIKIYKNLGSDNKKIRLFIILIFISAVSEIFGIALILPILKIILSTSEFIFINISFLNIEDLSFEKERLLIISLISIFLFYLAKTIFLSYFNYWRAKYIFSLNEVLSNKLFKIYLNQPYKKHLLKNSSEYTRNLIAIQNYVRNIDQAAILITEFVILFCFFVVLFIYEPMMTSLLSAICLTFALIYNRKITPISSKIGKDSHESSQELLQTINQGLFGIKDIKLYGRENDFFQYFNDKIKKFSKSLTVYEFLQPLPKILLEFLAVILIIVTIIILYYFDYGNDQIIVFIAMLAAIGFKLIPSINKIIAGSQHLKFYLPMTNAIISELSIDVSKEQMNKNKIDFLKNIELKNLDYSYNKNNLILKGVNLIIKKNLKIGIIGKSGSGKTTLINILLGLLDSPIGSIKIDDKIQNLNNRSWQDRIGYVPQNIYLIDDTIKKNIAFGISDENIDNEKIIKSLKIAQIDDFVSNLPETINTQVGENGSKLSGGQIQRLGIARAVYNDPEILIFDEASSSLDGDTEERMINEISKISINKTIIIVSHKKSALKYCNEIYSLVDKFLIKNEK